MKPWYETWSDSPIYHILYHHRDGSEVRVPGPLDRTTADAIRGLVLDVAWKRSAFHHLNKRGFDVCGFDLSKASIAHNRHPKTTVCTSSCTTCAKSFGQNYFDYVLNLFSSFGYFESERENHNAFRANAVAQ